MLKEGKGRKEIVIERKREKDLDRWRDKKRELEL
jgi:hypothetical protein